MGYAIVHYKPYTELLLVAKLTYASSAWIGFSSANDRQKITAFIRRSKRTGFCPSQLDDFSSLCDAADTRLFTEFLHHTMSYKHYSLHQQITIII